MQLYMRQHVARMGSDHGCCFTSRQGSGVSRLETRSGLFGLSPAIAVLPASSVSAADSKPHASPVTFRDGLLSVESRGAPRPTPGDSKLKNARTTKSR